MAQSTTANIEEELSQLNLNPRSQSSLEMPAMSLQHHPTWRQTVTPELRIKLTDQLFKAFTNSSLTYQQIQQCIEHAKKVENDIFETANSRSEYYILISRQVYEIGKERYIGEQSWKDSVPDEIRKHIVKKLAQTIIPGCDLETVDEQNSMGNLIEYAQKVECEILDAATSRSGYYKLIGEKIYNIQQAILEEQMDGCSQ